MSMCIYTADEPEYYDHLPTMLQVHKNTFKPQNVVKSCET